MTESWKPIPGTEGKYHVSDQGRASGPRGLLKPVTSKGYSRISLPSPKGWRLHRLHRLIAFAFVPGYAPGLEVCHNNGDKSDNRAANLRWDTHASNMQDVARHNAGLTPPRTHCIHGHEYTPENSFYENSPAGTRRRCRACHRKKRRAYMAKRRAAEREARLGGG